MKLDKKFTVMHNKLRLRTNETFLVILQINTFDLLMNLQKMSECKELIKVNDHGRSSESLFESFRGWNLIFEQYLHVGPDGSSEKRIREESDKFRGTN